MNVRPVSLRLFLAKNGIFAALILLIALFTLLNGNFFTLGNAQNILLQSSELAIVVIPLAFLLMSGSVDLSIGSVASASAVSSALVMSQTGNTLLGIGVGLLLGLVAGALNGLLVAYGGLNPIVVTLGFLSVWGGFAQLITGGKTVQRSSLPDDFRGLGTATFGPIPIQIVLLVVVIALGWYFLRRNRLGKEILAIGGNERAAHLMGVNVRMRRFQMFLASGVAAAIVGILLTAKVQSASPTIGSGMELQALTVVLLGGVAFEGGMGRISGVVAGLLFFKVLSNGLVFLQVSPFLQTMLVGATLIVAVALDRSIQRTLKRAWGQMGKRSVDEASDDREKSAVGE
jgi:ribose/xylose/arabinose/galactoside ABC-type transport system permease subunit